MTYRVIIHPEAIAGLKRNASWWAENRSPAQASRWLDAAIEAISRLRTHPQSHGLADENDEFPYEIRQLTFGVSSRRTHRAIFVIKEDTVHVLTIRSGSQDIIGPDDVRSSFSS